MPGKGWASKDLGQGFRRALKALVTQWAGHGEGNPIHVPISEGRSGPLSLPHSSSISSETCLACPDSRESLGLSLFPSIPISPNVWGVFWTSQTVSLLPSCKCSSLYLQAQPCSLYIRFGPRS